MGERQFGVWVETLLDMKLKKQLWALGGRSESYESLHQEEAKDTALVVKERAEGKSLCPKVKPK